MTRIIAGLFALFTAAAATAPAQAKVIKLATLIPVGSSWYGPLRDMAEAWQTTSNGAIKVKIYPGGIAGDDPEVVRKIRIGQLQAATITTEGLRRIIPDIMALHLPLLLRSADELDYIRNQISPELKKRIEAKGFTVLNWADAGWIRFFCKKPVVHPDDLKALKVFVWGGDTVLVKAWRDAGYQPVPLAATDILGGLQSGLIDCVPTVPIAALSYQWFGLAPHMTELKWAPFTGATVISTRVWRKFSKETRARMRAAAEQTGKRLKSRIRGLDQEAIEAMKQYGLRVHEVPSDVVPAWEAAARSGYKAFVGPVISPGFLAMVEKQRRNYRAQTRGK